MWPKAELKDLTNFANNLFLSLHPRCDNEYQTMKNENLKKKRTSSPMRYDSLSIDSFSNGKLLREPNKGIACRIFENNSHRYYPAKFCGLVHRLI